MWGSPSTFSSLRLLNFRLRDRRLLWLSRALRALDAPLGTFQRPARSCTKCLHRLVDLMVYGQLSTLVPWLTGTLELARDAYADDQDLVSDAFYTYVMVCILGVWCSCWYDTA